MPAPTFSYDVVSYPSGAFEATHPRRLATLAALYMREPGNLGLVEAPARLAFAAARILELGCGDGGNLLPMAYSLPAATFVGVDLAAKEIAVAKQTQNSLGLTNVEFIAQDILTLGTELGTFDYIIVHGVYSWVPAQVREHILWLCGNLLTEKGVAYISYNTLPGGHIRRIQRDLMRYHVRNEAEPAERVRKAREISRTIVAAVGPGEKMYSGVLSAERDRLAELDFPTLYHDDLAGENESLYLHEFVTRAHRHGLRYLADADFASMHPHRYPAAAGALLAQCQDRVEFEQYLDFMSGRTFRRTLLCRAAVELAPEPLTERAHSLWLVATATPQTHPVDLTGNQPARFRSPTGVVVGLGDPWAKAGLLCLCEAAPRALRYSELLTAVTARLQAASGGQQLDQEQLATALADLVVSMYGGGMVELHAQLPPVATAVNERPVVSALARQQVGSSAMLVNLWHRNVLIDNELALRIVPLLDGTKTPADVLTALSAAPTSTDALSPDELADALRRLSHLGFLCQPDP